MIRRRIFAIIGSMSLLVLCAPATAGAIGPTGDGSFYNPYVMECTSGSGTSCDVEFPAKVVIVSGDNQAIAYYRCPPDHPYLQNKAYNQPSKGLEVKAQPGVLAAMFYNNFVFPDGRWAAGNGTSEIINQTASPQPYEVWLHCTSDTTLRYN